ncbi:MAG: amidohydrolase, partial [Rhodospirillales bacterium]|nr:amidohydrolase [Rhodospirillales bacterium]
MTEDILAKARLQADERGLDDVFIVDADAHHYELNSWAEVVEYIPDPI